MPKTDKSIEFTPTKAEECLFQTYCASTNVTGKKFYCILKNNFTCLWILWVTRLALETVMSRLLRQTHGSIIESSVPPHFNGHLRLCLPITPCYFKRGITTIIVSIQQLQFPRGFACLQQSLLEDIVPDTTELNV